MNSIRRIRRRGGGVGLLFALLFMSVVNNVVLVGAFASSSLSSSQQQQQQQQQRQSLSVNKHNQRHHHHHQLGNIRTAPTRTRRMLVSPDTMMDVATSTTAATMDAIETTTTTTVTNLIDYQYAFMFPVVTLVAIMCQSAGIGGAALLSPIFLLVFPLFGITGAFPTAASAIACALLTECFGFASGLSGYWKRGLVDWDVAKSFLVFSLPAALGGALIEPSLASETTLLRAVYSTLMLGLCTYLFLAEKPDKVPDNCMVEPVDGDDEEEAIDFLTNPPIRSHCAADGTVYTYLQPSSRQNWKTTTATLSGAGLTGLLGVGMGEVILPQLVRRACMPLPVAAGTSVAVVVLTALTAALIQFIALANELTIQSNNSISLMEALVQVVPWSLVQFTIPGAVLGGQIAPYLAANRILDEDKVELAVATLFGVIGIAFAIKCMTG